MTALSESLIEREVRQRFSRVLQRNDIYLANHSLGRPLDQTAADVQEALSAWYSDMDLAWDLWMAEAARFERNILRLVQWDAGAVVPKANVGQGLRAVLNAMTDRVVHVVASAGEFDSVDFILKAYAEQGRATVHWVLPEHGPKGIPVYDSSALADAIVPGTDIVILSLVYFATGQRLQEVDALIRRAHDVGAVVILDTYHAAGVLPMVHPEADFILGGCYKYLRGGPGACWMAIHGRHLDGNLKTLDTGWFAKENTFGFERPEAPRREGGGRGWWESTPAILPLFQARAGLEFTLEIGVPEIRAYCLEQLAQLRSHLEPFGCFVPENPDDWGGFALLPSSEAKLVSQRLAEVGVVTDSRHGLVRFGPDLLNTRDEFAQLPGLLSQVMEEACTL